MEGRTSPQGPAWEGETEGLDHMGSAWGSIPLTLVSQPGVPSPPAAVERQWALGFHALELESCLMLLLSSWSLSPPARDQGQRAGGEGQPSA